MSAVAPEPRATGALGPSSCALGPHATGKQASPHLCNTGSFKSATIYYPTSNRMGLLPSVVIVGGWGCGEQAMAAWAPFYASHGIVAMTIGTPAPWFDSPATRCKALLDASLALQSEHEREGSVLQGRLDVSRRAVQGWSLGGGGAQLAALTDQTLKCVIALCPFDGSDFGCGGFPSAQRLSFPSEPPTSVPVLIVCGEKDGEALPKTQGWPHYRQTGAPKLIFEVKGGGHYEVAGPAGTGTESQVSTSSEENFVGCNCLAFYCCMCLCNFQEGSRFWCTPCPCSSGTLNAPSGHATDHAPRGAIGGVALAWLRLFLQGDENARSQLAIRPDIASSYESSGVTAPLVMDR